MCVALKTVKKEYQKDISKFFVWIRISIQCSVDAGCIFKIIPNNLCNLGLCALHPNEERIGSYPMGRKMNRFQGEIDGLILHKKMPT